MKTHILNHPLIEHKMSLLRDSKRKMPEFKMLLDEIGFLMVYEVTKDLDLNDTVIETPICVAKAKKLKSHPILVTILRAGLGLLDPFMKLMPNSKVGFLGMDRDEVTLQPRSYYDKIPMQALENRVLLIDPMLATGGSALNAIDFLMGKGVKDITFVCLVAAPEGIKAIHDKYPDIHIYAAALDEKLNDKGYIVPGLGDAGDRIFGTEDNENL